MSPRPETILIVDDEPTNVGILADLLEPHYQLLVATNGTRAIKIFQQQVVDLVLLDIIMPDMNGYEVCRRITADRDDGPPVIMISARDDTKSKVTGLQSGAVDYITKPFEEAEVLARIRTHLKLHALNTRLTHLVEEKSRELLRQQNLTIHNARLIQMGEMISAIAHQLKQPLNAMAVNLDLIELLLRREGSSEKIAAKIFEQHRQIHFMSDTIDTFRDFFSPARHATCFSIREAVNNVVRILEYQLTSANIQVAVEVDATLCYQGIIREFEHVLLNFLSNAKDAIVADLHRSGRIVVRAAYRDETLLLEVEDNGGGIPGEHLPHIFEPHFTTKAKNGGSGIGLSITRTIVENHMNGRVGVRNTDAGACFSIELPLPENADACQCY